MDNLQKYTPGLLLKYPGKEVPLVIDVVNPQELQGITATLAKQAFKMAGTELSPEDIFVLVEDVLETYYCEPIALILQAIIDIRKGKHKVYGKVTSNLLYTVITGLIERNEDERKSGHYANKGYGEIDPSPRTSSRHNEKTVQVKPQLKK